MCHYHRNATRQWGDPLQRRGIRKPVLRKYTRLVERTVKREHTERIEAALISIHARLMESAATVLRDAEINGFISRFKVQAAAELLAVLKEVPASDLGNVVAALCLLREKERPFVSDTAFLFGLAKAVRSRAGSAFKWEFSTKEGRARRRYRNLPIAATKMLARWLIDAHLKFIVYVERAAVAQSKSTVNALLTEGFIPLL